MPQSRCLLNAFVLVCFLLARQVAAQPVDGAAPGKPEITAFVALTNYPGEPGASPNQLIRRYNAEMTMNRPGWVLPHPETSAGATPSLFNCQVSVRNPAPKRPLYYALFYQNESYAFPAGHPRDEENFYGSWGHNEGNEPGFRKLPASSSPDKVISFTTGLRIRGNPRNEALYYDAPPSYHPSLADGENDVLRFGRWKRPPRMGKYRFLLVVTSDTAEIDVYARACQRRQHSGRFLNPFSYFLTQRFAHTSVLLAAEQLQVYLRPTNLGAPLAPRAWQVPATPEQRMTVFRHGTYGGGLVANVPVIADVSSADFTPADYNRLKHRFDDTTLAKTIEGRDGPTAAFADSGRIRLVNPAADPADPHKYDASVRTVYGFTYGRFRARIRFPQIVNTNGVWTGINPAFWLFSSSGERWNALDRTYTGDYCANDGRTAYAEIDLEIFKKGCYAHRLYTADGFAGGRRHQQRWLRKGGSFQDESCDSIVFACNNFDYMRRDIPNMVNGSAATPPCGPLGNNVLLTYQNRTHKLERYGASTVLASRPTANAHTLFGPHATWYEIEWTPTEIIWRIGPDEDHMQVITYFNDAYTVVPNVMMDVFIAQHWLGTNEWHPYFQEKLPYPARAFTGEILDFVVE